jgi:N-acetylglucosaminyl-diphospho-decaprenol L-rhamnosyltransferase
VSSASSGHLPDVTVIVVLYNSSAVLGRLLDSVRHAADRHSAEVVVVDNASDDRDASRRISMEHGARFVQLERNLGYGAGANAAFRQLEQPGENLLICNADLEFDAGAIDELVEYASRHSGIGSVGPAILNSDGSVYPSARRSPSLRVGIGHALLGDIAPRNRWSQKYREESAPSSEPREADWLSGACVLIPVERFERIGGFDEGYFMYFEDVDLGDRLRTAGWRNVYVPAARVTHLGGHSTQSTSGRMLAAHHASAYRYLARRYAGVWLAPVRLALRIGLALRLRAATSRNGRTAGSG